VGVIDDVAQVSRGWRWLRRSLVPRSAQPHTPTPERRDFPTGWARTPGARVVRQAVLRGGIKPLAWTETSPRVRGRDHLDGLAGPVVFAANHASHLDTPLILGSLPRGWADRVAVGAAADYFFDARWRAVSTALAFNTFPVDRHGGRRVTGLTRQLLGQGWSLLLFPEGSRSPDGWLQGFRGGIGRLCVDHGLTAVPIAVRGSFGAMPRGRGWPRPGRAAVSVRYGPPLSPEPGETGASFTQRLRTAMTRVWHEDATSWWDSLRADAEGTLPEPTGPPAPRWRRVWEATRPPRAHAPAPAWRRRR
jgi:1-acyl-sn-glycerol-3-phosphate acyltransferase